jgi:hypothetical protein
MLSDLLSKFSSRAEKEQYLLQLVKEHPYFTPAQFCLLQNTPVQEEAYRQRAAATALLFNNAGWLNFQLNNQFKEAVVELPADTQPLAPEPVATETITAEDTAPAEETVVAATAAPLTTTDTTRETPAEVEEAAANTMEPADTAKPISLPAQGTQAEEMLFEPLFATDYFASQGIKLSEEVLTGDKLGKQLKSFTEWLKSMKKTHPQEPAEAVDTTSSIPYIAEKSNEEGDVVTEAMAEVYALQGNTRKAIAIYRKLSLLNPPKSAYFAAKIENLK